MSTTGEDHHPAEYGDFELKRFLGMTLDDDRPGRARARLELGERHHNPNGVVHGAVLFALVDTAMGKATMSVLPEGSYCASVDVQLRFIRPASEGEITAEVEVLKAGRTVVHLEGRVVSAEDKLVATASGTFTVFGV